MPGCHAKQFRSWIAALLLLLPVAVWADIAAFNRAMQSGDYQAAARETLEIWADFDRDSSQTATIAREFGLVNYLARDLENAHMFADFLHEQGATLRVPDDQPEVSKLLRQLLLFSAQPEQQRDELAAALNSRVALPGIDSISLLAAETLYRNDWGRGRWAQAKLSAAMAAELNSRAGHAYLRDTREAQVIRAAADFLEVATHSDYEAMVEVHNRLVSDIEATQDNASRTGLMSLKWQAEAWTRTMESYFHASSSNIGTLIGNRLRYRTLNELPTAVLNTVLELAGTDNDLPVCMGKIDVGALSYPIRWAEQRLVGSVIVQLSFDEAGKIEGSQILAEAPAGLFTEAINAALPGFTWQPDSSVEAGVCTLEQSNLVHTIGFWGNCAASFVRGDCPRSATINDARSIREAGNL